MKLYAYLAAALALAGLIWYEVGVHRKASRVDAAESALEASRAQHKADMAALQAAWDHERSIATEASNDYERRLQALNDARDDTPVRSVRLCRSPTGWVPAPAPAASGAGPGDPAGQPQETGRNLEVSRDIGPDLYALADRADQHAAQCNSLIKWVESR